MREHKFRAWNKRKKEWVKNIFYISDEGYVMQDYGFNKFQDEGNSKICPLGSVEIVRYTGLKDKKGKEIFEGDIIRIDGGGKPVNVSVGFQNGCFVINAPWIKGDVSMPELKYYTFFAELDEDKSFKDCILTEIIGNIYESPELLKVNNNGK